MTAPKYCPACGQPYSRLALMNLRPNTILEQLYTTIKNTGIKGIRSDKLFAKIYSVDPKGGPDSGVKILSVQVWHINKIIRGHKQIVRSRRIKGTHFVSYYLSKIK